MIIVVFVNNSKGECYMKKILTLLLVLALGVSLCACKPGAEENAEKSKDAYAGTFRVGYGEALMNPIESVPLGGYGNTSTRMSQNITDDLYIRCIALTDENETTQLIFSLDSVRVYNGAIQAAAVVAAQIGVSYENILINASHSHSTPDMSSTDSSIDRYMVYFQEQFKAAAVAALDDRKPCQMYYGTSETEGLSWIRHYLMDDGTYGGDSFGDWDNHYAVGHTAEPDTTMHVLKFTRDGGKDIVVVNWRVHPGLTAGAGKALNASSDVIGPFRDTLEDMADCSVIYLQGHAGNINPGSRIDAEEEYTDYKQYGVKLAGFAYEALQDMNELPTGELRSERIQMTCDVNHDQDHLAGYAAVVSGVWRSTNDHAAAREAGAPYGIRSPYHANAISANAKRSATEELEVNVFAIGNSVGFTAGPAELFDRNSMAIEESSPFEVTLCMGYTNGHIGYIPADYVWEYTSYETDITRYKRGTAEKIQETMLDLLEQLYEG